MKKADRVKKHGLKKPAPNAAGVEDKSDRANVLPVWPVVDRDEQLELTCAQSFAEAFKTNPAQPQLLRIAREAGCSRNRVRSLLGSAQKKGLLTLTVYAPRVDSLSTLLMEQYGLAEAIVPTFKADPGSQASVRSVLAPVIVRYLSYYLSRSAVIGKRQIRIGIDGGATLYKAFREADLLSVPNIGYDILPLVYGPLPGTNPSAVVVANMLASKLRVPAEQVKVLNAFHQLSEEWVAQQPGPQIQIKHLETIQMSPEVVGGIDLILTGLGSSQAGKRAEELEIEKKVSSSARSRYHGDVCNLAFDKQGNEIPELNSNRLVLVNIKNLREFSLERKTLVVAAAGGADKVESLRTALRARLISVLITDVATAHLLTS